MNMVGFMPCRGRGMSMAEELGTQMQLADSRLDDTLMGAGNR